jgi:hypothetical protein
VTTNPSSISCCETLTTEKADGWKYKGRFDRGSGPAEVGLVPTNNSANRDAARSHRAFIEIHSYGARDWIKPGEVVLVAL